MDIPGDQYPWATENQRLIFKKDTYETISEAWAQLPMNLPHAYQSAHPESHGNGKYIE